MRFWHRSPQLLLFCSLGLCCLMARGEVERLYPYIYNLMWVGQRHEKISNIPGVQPTQFPHWHDQNIDRFYGNNQDTAKSSLEWTVIMLRNLTRNGALGQPPHLPFRADRTRMGSGGYPKRHLMVRRSNRVHCLTAVVDKAGELTHGVDSRSTKDRQFWMRSQASSRRPWGIHESIGR